MAHGRTIGARSAGGRRRAARGRRGSRRSAAGPAGTASARRAPASTPAWRHGVLVQCVGIAGQHQQAYKHVWYSGPGYRARIAGQDCGPGLRASINKRINTCGIPGQDCGPGLRARIPGQDCGPGFRASINKCVNTCGIPGQDCGPAYSGPACGIPGQHAGGFTQCVGCRATQRVDTAC
jgi:hypothetical protein